MNCTSVYEHYGNNLRCLLLIQSSRCFLLIFFQADLTHNRQLLLEALWTCSCRRLLNRAAVDNAVPSTPSLDTERRFPAEVAKHLAQMLVELVTPDVMFNDITWPEEEFIKVTIERWMNGRGSLLFLFLFFFFVLRRFRKLFTPLMLFLNVCEITSVIICWSVL